eukprot:CAMPEP_0202437536 /NCGR_PEP_ID=MMETSP1345-20130828/29616_1 /ASSEMBLY_ACC=CAM_ASM_000843 /TAXON_ID=342563 /ORGANISM="Fabrea Fabrea salina" /LENGTH=34 /DNA_ID= /DNA_START= /DNA_END= /DNA_ORIENTATION=
MLDARSKVCEDEAGVMLAHGVKQILDRGHRFAAV